MAGSIGNPLGLQEEAWALGYKGVPHHRRKTVGDRIDALLAAGMIAPIPGLAPGILDPEGPRGQGCRESGSFTGGSGLTLSGDGRNLMSFPVAPHHAQRPSRGPAARAEEAFFWYLFSDPARAVKFLRWGLKGRTSWCGGGLTALYRAPWGPWMLRCSRSAMTTDRRLSTALTAGRATTRSSESANPGMRLGGPRYISYSSKQ